MNAKQKTSAIFTSYIRHESEAKAIRHQTSDMKAKQKTSDIFTSYIRHESEAKAIRHLHIIHQT